MDLTKMMFGGALIGTLVSCWATLKSILWRICTVVLKKAVIDESLKDDLLNYLRENYKHYYLHDRMYKNHEHYIKKDRRYQKTGWETFNNCSIIFLAGKVPFYYSQYENQNKDNSGNTVKSQGTILYYIRGSLDIDKIVQGAVLRKNTLTKSYVDASSKNMNRFFIKYIPDNKKGEIKGGGYSYDFTSWSERALTHSFDEMGLEVTRDGLNKIVLTKENRDIVKLAELWFNNRSWFQERDVPWKMGWLLHGPPGSGKTLISRRIAEHLNIPMFVYRLGMMGDHQLSEAWAEMQSQTPCMALIEDFDNVFHGRENITKCDFMMDEFFDSSEKKTNGPEEAKSSMRRGGKVSFDNLLNTLDGAERYEGILTIITTNHIDKVDPALLDRPGRVDKVIELTYLTEENKLQMIDRILWDMPLARQEALQYVKANTGEHLTPARLQEVCTSLALKSFYQSLEATNA